MDAVNAFNQELFSLMDSKPPISRAKMISITKSAIKAMKLYKHVVQIVEKFIKKCKSEYKVAGLYVVDSIVRQSRHQFGADKDVFGPRFTKNIVGTFENLCLCPLEDRSKLVRVLNLWQKNGVFKSNVIQPLLDMAAGTGSGSAPYAEDPASSPPTPTKDHAENSAAAPVAPLEKHDPFTAVAQLFQSTQGQQMLQNLQQSTQAEPASQPPPFPDTPSVAPVFSNALPHPPQAAQQKSAFDKTLLDRFDYDDEPEAGDDAKDDVSQPSLMQQPPAFQQPVMNMTQDLSQQGSLPPNGQLPAYGLMPGQSFQGMMPPMGQAQPGQPFPGSVGPPGFHGVFPPPTHSSQQHQELTVDADRSSMRDGRHDKKSRSDSRSPKRRRSRSNSRTRRSRHRRSRSRDRRHLSPRSRSEERRERERERERRQKGLPPTKNETLSICSTTLWVGQLDKRTQQQDVASWLEEFGQIESINMIPPRGCAYIVMIHREDAFRALQKLSRGSYKVNQKAIKIAWAPNKGIRADLKQFWDVELGVTYVPWSKVREEQLEELKEGGILDLDTLSPEWKTVRKALENPEELNHNGGSESQQPDEARGLAPPPSTQVPPMLGMPSVPPPGFPAPIGIPPPSFPPGMPPPPLFRPGFNPMQMPPGFPPLGAMPLSMPPLPPSKAEDMPPVNRKHGEEISDAPNFFNNQMGAMCNQVGVPPGGSIQTPPGGLLGNRPGMMQLPRPPGPPMLHAQRFPPPPVRPHMVPRGPPPPMMRHDGPPPTGSFPMPHSMRPPFPPHGPPPQGPPPHGPPLQGPPPQGLPPQGPSLPPFIRPGAPRPPNDEDSHPFRGERPGLRESERGFGGTARRPFVSDRSDARDRLEESGWERDRRDWRDRENGSREAREKGKEGERPKRRERASRWDRDDRLTGQENTDKLRTPNALAAETEASQKTTVSAPPLAPSPETPPPVEAKQGAAS
ncbi:SR-related and CTD-associated factor 4 isoform X2 [Corythoichthys intestinalis]|uniref:SR-related and CTD-associated factor 4 isoform X2 n=1 Tax=Corythoichthys intestinalis TaxID=161448 RepID=UPI0025A4F9C2|nr:SR-related and CTD-associated factor 4 isoform X2 [Corythoichthys intestinalis]